MLLTEYDEAYEMELLREEYRAEGFALGYVEVMNKYVDLLNMLLSAQRYEDIRLAAVDLDHRKRLFIEFGIEY